VTPDDHFRLASLSKTYTATVVLRLVAAHELGLSDTVGRWLLGVLPADKRRCEKIVVLSIAELMGKAIRNIHEEASVTSLFV